MATDSTKMPQSRYPHIVGFVAMSRFIGYPLEDLSSRRTISMDQRRSLIAEFETADRFEDLSPNTQRLLEPYFEVRERQLGGKGPSAPVDDTLAKRGILTMHNLCAGYPDNLSSIIRDLNLGAAEFLAGQGGSLEPEGASLEQHASAEKGFPRPVGAVESKIFRNTLRSSLPTPRFEPYDAFAHDGDGDGIVQEGTIWERPAGTRFVDKFGREVADSLTLIRPSRHHRIVDSDGREVTYEPTWRKGKKPRLGPTIRTIVSTSKFREDDPRSRRPVEVNALISWFDGSMLNMREHVFGIINGTPIEKMSTYRYRKPHVVAYERAEAAAMMDLISDGKPFDEPLFRGEQLPMSAESLLHELKPGTQIVLPMRSFSRKEETAMEYLEDPDHEEFEHASYVLYELMPGSQGADFQEIAKRLADKGQVYDQTWGSDERFMLASDAEHVIFGTVEIVEIQQISDSAFGPYFRIVLRQIDTLGKPEDGGTWA